MRRKAGGTAVQRPATLSSPLSTLSGPCGTWAEGEAPGWSRTIRTLSARRRTWNRSGGSRVSDSPSIASGIGPSASISSSFPSGHTASAFAFATGAGAAQPALSAPLRALATLARRLLSGRWAP
ncbi:MAG: hypothetical protein WA862_08550 [Solirubrobacterales bacterium]